MTDRTKLVAQMAATIYAGLASNPNVVAEHPNSGWEWVNTPDPIGEAVSIALTMLSRVEGRESEIRSRIREMTMEGTLRG